MSSQTKFRILSLDGGGIRGVITARILEEIENQLGKPCNEYFDLITGTSTGSILAAGLVMGKRPSELIGIYEDNGQKIFNSSWFKKNVSSWVNQPKYSNEGLIDTLKTYLKHKEFGHIKFGQISQISKAKLLILAYDTFYRQTTFFISHNSEEEKRWFDDVKLWEVCASSASAPTFFPPYEFKWVDPERPEKEWKFPHVDGGVAANNPSLAALSHVIGAEKKSLEDISILSIGTGRTTEPLQYEEVKGWGLLGWAKRIPDVFMGGQFQISADICGQILTSANPNGYLRLQFELNQRTKREDTDSPPDILFLDERKNFFTGKKVSEEIDDGSKENIKQLRETTEAFLKSDEYRTIDGKSFSVKQSIAKFIQDNS